MNDDSSPEELELSRRLATGPVGQFVNKIPLMFCQAVLIAYRDSDQGSVSMNSGTMTLVRLNGRQLGITCQHVIQKYLDVGSSGSDAIFQVGNHLVDPVRKLIDSSKELDLVVLDLSDWTEMCNSNSAIGCSFFEPRAWPPPLPRVGNSVEIGGFPGVFRKRPSAKELEFGTWSAGKMTVRSVLDGYIKIQFERESWIELPGTESGMDLRDLGGISGGPVTVEWTNAAGIWVVDLLGIACQYNPSCDLLFARPLSFVREDGTICSQSCC